MDNFSINEIFARVTDLRIEVGPTGSMLLIVHMAPISVDNSPKITSELQIGEQDSLMDLRVQDTVIVRYAEKGRLHIVGYVADRRPANATPFSMPSSCPACGSSIMWEQGVMRCSGSWLRCPAQRKEGLRHFISADAMNISGLAPFVDPLVDQKTVRNPADLYRMGFTSLVALSAAANESAQAVYAAIQQSKKTTMARFIFALGIRHVDLCSAERLALSFPNIDSFLQASGRELINAARVDERTASSIQTFLSDALNIEFIEQLRAVGVICNK